MHVTTIFNNLTEASLISNADKRHLIQISDPRSFLHAVITVYENKTRLYLQACDWDVKRVLQEKGVARESLNSAATQKSMSAAYDAFLEIDKVSFLGSLRRVLVKNSPDLLSSLGLKSHTKTGGNLLEIAKQVFIAYTARRCLFQAVDRIALHALCQKTDTDESAPFPLHLFNAFQLEKSLSAEIKKIPGQTPPEARAKLLTELFQSRAERVYEGVRGLLFFLGTVIHAVSPSSELRDRYFRYLRSPQERVEFINRVSQGYIGVICQEQQQLELLRDNSTALCSKIHHVCLPSLTLLDVKVTRDISQWKREVARLNEALVANQDAEEEIKQKMNEEKEKAFQQIDKWRASVPQRPITFYANIGFRI